MSSDFSSMYALVLGAGSIGSRHGRNLRAAGVGRIAIHDTDRSASGRLASEIGGECLSSLDAAFKHDVPTVGFVCTPPHLHADQAVVLLQNGVHVFVEKPLSHSSEEITRIAQAATQSGCRVQVGYNLRFHPGVMLAKQFLDSGLLGRILWARFEVGQYLPDWRPNTDYRVSYTASSRLGGGILLDASHEIDYACWLLGEPVELSCMTGRSGVLEMDAEDCASLIIRFERGAQADIHLDCLQRTYARQCKIVGELGTLIWDYTLNEVRVWRVAEPEWRSYPYSFQGNDMYRMELDHFLRCVLEGRSPDVGIPDGLRAVRVVEAAKKAASVVCPVNAI